MFFFSKTWRDHEDGIEAVTLHWLAIVSEDDLRWQKARQIVMIPQFGTSPTLRHGSVWIFPPFSQRQLWTRNHDDSDPRFLIYCFFEVVQRGRRWSTESERQEIRALPITHNDFSAEATEAFLYYSVDNWAHVHRAAMFLDGLPMKHQSLPPLPADVDNINYTKQQARRYRLIARIPPPHVFRGYLWGPIGARALYAVYLSREGALNPFSEGGSWLLNDGRLWEVQL